MKKTFAIILSVVMLVCCIPFAASAATQVVFEGSDNFKNSNQLVSDTEYTIKSGVTMTVPSDLTLYIPADAKLTVAAGATLNVYGSIVILSGGELYADGFINGSANIVVNEGASALAQVRFPALEQFGLKDRVEVSYGFSANGDIYEDVDGSVTFTKVVDSKNGTKVYAPLNQYVYVKVLINEPEKGYDKYDDSLLTVYFNGVGIPYRQGSHHTKLTTSVDVSYKKWTNDSDFLNTFNIYLPTGEGYTVYGREGEQSADGETVKLKYGQSFSFTVEIDPEYDMSAYEVYIYNGYGWTNLDTSTLLKDIAPAVPDEYGYYHIGAETGGIKGEHTIYVVGVVKNETLLMVGDILDMVRNIFEMITGFFAELLGFLGLDA